MGALGDYFPNSDPTLQRKLFISAPISTPSKFSARDSATKKEPVLGLQRRPGRRRAVA